VGRLGKVAVTEPPAKDPYGKGGEHRWFWWADSTHKKPGLWFRRRRLIPWR
jgi:hypothetical protein